MADQNKTISSFNIIRRLVRDLYLEGLNNYLNTDSFGKSSRAYLNNLTSIRTFLDNRFISSKTSTKKGTNPVISFDTRYETENPLFALWKTENTPLFNVIYSTYYLIVRKLVEQYLKRKVPLSSDERVRIIHETTFIDKQVVITDFIENKKIKPEITTIFHYSQYNLSFPIKNVPDFPLSTIELRFLAAILQDKRVRMFMNDKTVQAIETELENVLPLWKPENVKYFDQNKDSDPFDNPDYRNLFQTILRAINTKQYLHLVYGRKNFSTIYTPIHLDYSQKDDTFRLFVKEIKYPINLRNIKKCNITTESPTSEEESTEYETLKVEIFDNTKAHYHFNRAIRQFSYFKKSCKKTEKNNTYEMSVDYDKSDESEIVIKVLMFGPNMKVLEPQSVIDEIKKRVTRQNQLFELEF